MSQQSHLTFVSVEPECNSQSFRLKLDFTERNWQRAKEENSRLQQKLTKMQMEIAGWKNEKKALMDKIDQLQKVIARHSAQKEGLVRKLDIRTQRHHAQQSNNLSQGEKELIERKIRRSEAQLLTFKDEQQMLTKRYHNVQSQLSQQRKQNISLRQQIVSLQKQNIEDLSRLESVEKLYNQKIVLIETENNALKKQIDSLIIEIKLFERKQQIENLLTYEEKIGIQVPFRHSGRKPTARTLNFDSQNSDPNTFSSECLCGQFQQQIFEKDELISLLKQKNQRLISESESLKKRCTTLQNIICTPSV